MTMAIARRREAAEISFGAQRPSFTGGMIRKAARLCAAMAVAMSASACAAFLPQSGPTTGDVLNRDRDEQVGFALMALDGAAVSVNRAAPEIAFADERFRGALPLRTALLGRGDVLRITIWEPVEDGLLTTPGTKQAVIEQVEVDDRGHIYVPFAGEVHVAGKTIGAARNAIIAQLIGKTSDPQVTVTRADYRSRGVALQGELRDPGLKPLDPQVSRLLPMLAAAGGATTPPHTTRVVVRRGEAATSGYLDAIYNDPRANIALRNGDVILVQNDTRYFNAFGAVLRPGRLAMTSGDMTLLDAISQAGGLNSDSANPTGVFLIRREPSELLQSLTPVDEDEAENITDLAATSAVVPTVYQLPMNSAESLVLAQSFALRENDTIYVTEAPFTQFRKVLSVIIPTLGTAGGAASLATVGSN